ncbi:MAG: LacI family transcriptional regulator [Chloroflexi bacterium]|nr:LacI family transcriptional regulator [Chloroflexota bacterium]MCI0648771.1 LacI family transcriptional regulator [Chloroflexota bacterium]MCI0727239.1 LacI family transcriptional regulator [Chloroflexota bacterium]
MSKNGLPKPNPSKVTQQDVAELAGVSRGIVSYVINNGPRAVAPETRERVLRAIAELGYRPNKHAQQLMREQWGSVAERDLGLILPNVALLQRPYYGSILAGIHQTAHDYHYRIRFMRFFDELQNPALFNELIHREEISGLILMSLDQCITSDADRQMINQIRERIDNVVCLEWHLEGLPSVSFDRAAAAYKATTHLINVGHQNIVYLGLGDERVTGYHQARIENKLPIEPSSVFYAHDLESGYQEVGRVLAEEKWPRAIVAGSDEIAFGILRNLREQKISVPQEIALASIDNIPMAAYAAPPLTTIDVPKIDMGRVAVDVLVNNSKGNRETTVLNLLPTKLIVRESCGAIQQ